MSESNLELCYMPATEAIKKFQEKTLSPVELVSEIIKRSEKVNATLNVFNYTCFEDALEKAKKAEKRYLDNSNELVRGQRVIALGNPHNLFTVSKEPTATVGIISGKNVNFGLRKSGHVYQNMIQTDASINRGNSGGPLVNLSGEVVGINTFIVSTTESHSSGGIGFSIPISRVENIIKDLKEKGVVKRTWFTGIKVEKLTQNLNIIFYIR